MLPSDRLRRAGATDVELAQLEAEHESASKPAQDSLTVYFERIATGDIVEWLEDLRRVKHFGDPQHDADLEAVVGLLEAKRKRGRKTS